MSLIKHSSWNIIGYLIPSLIAIPAMGIMARKLGIESFGLFTLLFALVGYASIFDVGISRAVTRMIAIHQDDVDECISICGTATWFILFLATLGAAILYLFSNNIVFWLKVSPELYDDAVLSLKIMSFSIPLFLLTQVWLGVLEGLEKFSVINIQRIVTSSSIALFPLIGIYIENKLSYAIYGLLSARFFTFIVVWVITKKYILKIFSSIRKRTLYALLSFGGWLTVSNIISPIMVYFDRFILSNLSGAHSVAQYTAPSDLVSRLGIFPGAIAKALFPKLSKSSKDYQQGLILLIVTALFSVIPLFILAEWLLVFWLGSDYSGTPATVLRILLIGFFFNALAQAPFAAIQAKGHAKTTAYIHLIELIPYLLLLTLLIHFFGVLGVALAWSIRVIVDFIILYIVHSKLEDS
ncbi:MAG: flippase [Xanthomonadaceae bacterium]|nr:flippase [Xanthomonadaceae bacterium]